MCRPHSACKAGEWTSALGTATADTGCTSCSPGTARTTAPATNTVLETASACPLCDDPRFYSDASGLLNCKRCPAGHFGVVQSGANAAGGHTACDDDTCELPQNLPTNSMLVTSQCPDHGRHGTAGHTHSNQTSHTGADICVLQCKPGFYSSSPVITPFTCAPDGQTTTASYQGGAITCTGLHAA